MVAEQSPTAHLCGCGCGASPKTAGARFVAGHHTRIPGGTNVTAMLPCVQCGRPVASKPSQPHIYCNLLCRSIAGSDFQIDNGLKRRFVGEMRARQLTASAAARETGVNVTTIRSWLQRRDHLLKPRSLGAVAAWLGISTDEALTMQGGDAETKRLRRLHDSPKMQAEWERLRTDPARQRRSALAAAQASRGRRLPPEVRAKMRESALARWQRPRTYNPGRHMKTLRGRAQAVLINLRRFRPGRTAEQIEAEAIQRLMQPPYNVKSEEAARTLLAPKPKRKPVRRRAARHPERCVILQELDAAHPRTKSGKRRYGFIEGFERRLRDVEGDETPEYTVLKVWIDRHVKVCPRHGGVRIGKH